ncbi:MAG: hypothetical protein KAT70_05540 [Thermoplasmata archaeon]|nr:hypothetical protein [Thermoplasmata archaeon]
MTKSRSNGYQLIAPPPAQLYALTDPEDETAWDKFMSFLSGVKYTFALSIMLWWLPIIGQCVAGYVGGRRAGSPYRGFLAAITPVLVFIGISYLINGTPLPTENPILAASASLSTSLSSVIPFLVPYLSFSGLYLGDFMGALQDTTMLRVSTYTVVIVFAFIGGLMADQSKKEFRNVFKMVSPVNIKGGQPVWTNYPKGQAPVSFDSMRSVPAASASKKKSPGIATKTAKKSGGAKTKAKKPKASKKASPIKH